MKPLKLEVRAFGPFVGSQQVDFEKLGQHGLFLIHGATGSGKSSLLDALCYALFGDTSGGERDGKDFVTTLEAEALTMVKLDFEHKGEKYRVTRYPTQRRAKLRGDGHTVQQAEGSLENLTAGKVLASKPSDVSDLVRELLRCDVAQFRQTVVLPQGDFRRVVTDHKARREILASIFRTSRFADFAERLKEIAAGLTRQGEAIETERRSLLAEMEAANEQELQERLAAAAGAEREAETAKGSASDRKDAALTAKLAGESLQEDFAELERLRLSQAELAGEQERMASRRATLERGKRAARLKGDRDHVDAKRRECQERDEKLKETRDAHADMAEELRLAREAQAELEGRRADLEAAEREFHRLQALRPRIEGLADRLARQAERKEALERAREREAAAGKVMTETDSAIASLAGERRKLQSLAGKEVETVQAVTEAEERLAALHRVLEFRDSAARLGAEIESLRVGDHSLAQLGDAVRRHAAGMLSQGLVEGEPCPVCGSERHPSPPAVAEEEDALEAVLEEFRRASAHLAGLEERRAGCERNVAQLCAEQGWSDAMPAHEELSEALLAVRSELERVQAAKERLEQVDASLEELHDTLAEQQEARESAAAEAARVEGELQGIAGEISGALEGLAPEHRDPNAFEQVFTATREAFDQLRKGFEAAGERVQEAARQHALIDAELHSAESELERARQALEVLEAKFAEKLDGLGFADRAEFECAERGDDDLEELERVIGAYDNSVNQVRSDLGKLEEKLAGKELPDLGALSLALAEAQEAYSLAEKAWSAARDEHNRAKEKAERFFDLDRQDAVLAKRRAAARRLSDLANGQLNRRSKLKFETFVLQSIFHQVLEVGNRQLRHMTAGRYAMRLRLDDSASSNGLELDVSDNFSGGQTRPVHTLSGGEGFLASLALALGLSEIAQRQSGGVELGALFIDEGFGSLDPQSLDQAVEILRGLQDEQRMVGVISHVEELKRRIPVQLLVRREELGSKTFARLNI